MFKNLFYFIIDIFKKSLEFITRINRYINCDKSIVNYTYDKNKNLIVFLKPEVTVSKLGNLIFGKTGLLVNVEHIRHLVHTKKPGITLGYLNTVLVNNKRISQSFFPLAGVVAISERSSKEKQKKENGQFFETLHYRSIIDE